MALNKFPTAHCIWGWPANMTMADFPSSYANYVPLIAQVSVDSYGQYVGLNARGIQLEVLFQNPTGTCDLELYVAVDGVDTKVWSKTGLTPTTCDSIFIGNVERVDLAGQPVKIHVVNLQNGWVSVNARPNA